MSTASRKCSVHVFDVCNRHKSQFRPLLPVSTRALKDSVAACDVGGHTIHPGPCRRPLFGTSCTQARRRDRRAARPFTAPPNAARRRALQRGQLMVVCRLQLRAVAEVKRRLLDRAAFSVPPKLYLIGGCRHEADRMRAAALRSLAVSLDVVDNVEFMINAPFDDMLRVLGSAAVGLHTMTDEHFGIGVVEYMAAGCVAVAHDSGAAPRSHPAAPPLHV